MVSLPPRFPSVALVLRPGSLDRVWLWKSRSLPTDLRLRISLSEHMSAGSSRDERVDELYTLILRLGNGSSRGDVVMGILCGLSLMPCCREKRGPRKVPAVAVRSGGAEGCRGLGLSIDREGVVGGWGGGGRSSLITMKMTRAGLSVLKVTRVKWINVAN